MNRDNLIIDLLNEHKSAFDRAKRFSDITKQPIPTHTVNWSQILISVVTGINGLDRKKGPDLSDGSDVKGASVWDAIDTPRFNGVVPAGRILTDYKSSSSLYKNIYFVLWDYKEEQFERCRIWCVNPSKDALFKEVVDRWYQKRETGEIKSSNFQLHPPRNKEGNIFKNTCGNLNYPLMMEAIFNLKEVSYELTFLDRNIPNEGLCNSVF